MAFTEIDQTIAQWIDGNISEQFGQGGPVGAPVSNPVQHLAKLGPHWSWGQIWNDIAGHARARPSRPTLTQAQINTNLTNLVMQLHWEIGALAGTVNQLAVNDQLNLASVAGQLSGDIVRYFSQARAAATAAFVEAEHLYDRATRDRWGSEAQLRADTQADVVILQREINQAIAGASLEVANAYNAVMADLSQAVTGLQRSVAAAEAGASLEVSNAYNALHTIEQTDVHSLQANINTVANQVTNGLASQLAQVTGLATGLAAGAEAGAVAKTVAQLSPIIDKVKTEVDTCLAPLCDTVTPNANQLGKLGQLLKSWEGAGVAALLAAVVAEAIADPQAAADEVAFAAGWTADIAVDLVDAVAGA